MYRDYQSEQVLLTSEMKLKREEDIISKKNSYNLYNKSILEQMVSYIRKDKN